MFDDHEILFFIAVIVYFISIKPLSSTFLGIMAGFLFITAGVAWIANDPSVWSSVIVGVVFTAIGVYLLINEGLDLLKGKN